MKRRSPSKRVPVRATARWKDVDVKPGHTGEVEVGTAELVDGACGWGEGCGTIGGFLLVCGGGHR